MISNNLNNTMQLKQKYLTSVLQNAQLLMLL